MEKYKAKQDLPLGVSKGNTVEVDDKGICRTTKGSILPYKPKDEKLFFEPVPYTSDFAIGARVCVSQAKEYVLFIAKGYERASDEKTKTLSAYESMGVTGVIKIGNRLFYTLVHHRDPITFIVPVGEVITYMEYWFISSSGKVQDTRQDKNPDADTFRKRMGNYFHTKYDAQTALYEWLAPPQQGEPSFKDLDELPEPLEPLDMLPPLDYQVEEARRITQTDLPK